MKLMTNTVLAHSILLTSGAALADGVLVPISIERGVRVRIVEGGELATLEETSMESGFFQQLVSVHRPLWSVEGGQNTVLSAQGGIRGFGVGFPQTDVYSGPALELEAESWVEYEFQLTQPAYIDLRGELHAGFVTADLITGTPFARVALYGPDDEVVLTAAREASWDYEEYTQFFTTLTAPHPAGHYRLSIVANGNLEAWGDEDTWGSGDASWTFFMDAAETPSPGCPAVEPYLVSAAPDGTEGDRESLYPGISGDGRYVAFVSDSTNIDPDTPGSQDYLYVYDRMTRRAKFIAFTFIDSPASLTGNGQFAVFLSEPPLLPHDSNDLPDVYMMEVATGALQIVSVSTDGLLSDAGAYRPSVSADGLLVAFSCSASNWPESGGSFHRGVYVRRIAEGTTTRIDRGIGGQIPNDDAESPSISANGLFVGFRSRATNLIASDTNGLVADVFVTDIESGTTTCVSVTPSGHTANGASSNPALSSDGRYVAFQSSASDLTPGDSNGRTDIYLRDMLKGETMLVSAAHTGGAGNGPSSSPAISGDGRYIVFESAASDLVPRDTNNRTDVFLFDRERSLVRRVNVNRAGDVGPRGGPSTGVTISADGQYVAFHSPDNTLVANDDNGDYDVFLCWVGDAFDRTPGDADYDGVVGFTDLNILLEAFGDVGPTLGADFNADGTVDFADLNALLGSFAADCG